MSKAENTERRIVTSLVSRRVIPVELVVDYGPEQVYGRLFNTSSEGWLKLFEEVGGTPAERDISLVRVVSVPEGEAPLEFRKGWVGSVLPTFTNNPRKHPSHSLVDHSDCGPMEGYLVPGGLAVSTLRMDGKDSAAAYWYDLYRGRNLDAEDFIFDVSSAEPVVAAH